MEQTAQSNDTGYKHKIWIEPLNLKEPNLMDIRDRVDQLRDISAFASDIIINKTDLSFEGRCGFAYVLWHLRDGMVNVGQALANYKRQSANT
ncbi:MAG: hypothetical protein HQL06_10135 [Nitrospirae bacterium]|nr:hypothetical protein [Nitrospirota bacterium]MBF0344574.1 hypothetical protein [Nitrospirota bacterium]